MTSLRVLAIIVVALAACSNPTPDAAAGAPATPTPTPTETPVAKPAAPSLADVAFKTFRGDNGDVVVFATKSKTELTWPNMGGSTVHGTYTQTGPEIEIHWDPKVTNYGVSIDRLHQLDPCSMARYEYVDHKGKTVESTLIFQQVRPRCETVRMTK